MRQVRQAQGLEETKEDRQRDRNKRLLAEGFDKKTSMQVPVSLRLQLTLEWFYRFSLHLLRTRQPWQALNAI